MGLAERRLHLLQFSEQRPLPTVRAGLATLSDALAAGLENWRFRFDTDYSDTLALRAASATVISPASTHSTSRVFPSGGNALGRAMGNLQGQIKSRPEPNLLKRDTTPQLPVRPGDLHPITHRL